MKAATPLNPNGILAMYEMANGNIGTCISCILHTEKMEMGFTDIDAPEHTERFPHCIQNLLN